MNELLESKTVLRTRKPLLDFLTEQRVMNLATIGTDGPYSTPVFYAVADHGETLFFMSKISSAHSLHISRDSRAGASIYMVTKEFGKTQGAQFTGRVELLHGAEESSALKIYYSRHRLAKAVKPLVNDVGLYAFRVDRVKMTDRRFGFGKPQIWDFKIPD